MTEQKEGWYSHGAEEAQKARKAMEGQYRPTMWLKAGESAKVVFLDGVGMNIATHTLNIRGKFKSYTCAGARVCPLCRAGKELRIITVYRVIDTRSYTGGDGKTHVNQERYYEAGSKIGVVLEKLHSEGLLAKRIILLDRLGEGKKTVYTASHIGKPKVAPPVALLEPKKDYKPKTIAELEMLADTLDGGTAGKYEEAEPAGQSGTISYEEEAEDAETPPPPPARKKPPVRKAPVETAPVADYGAVDEDAAADANEDDNDDADPEDGNDE